MDEVVWTETYLKSIKVFDLEGFLLLKSSDSYKFYYDVGDFC